MYVHEALPLDGYIGGGLMVVGAIIHTWSAAERPSAERIMQQWRSPGEPLWVSLLTTVGYPFLFLSVGTFILYGLGGFPPHTWRGLHRFWPTLPTLMQPCKRMSDFFLVRPAACSLMPCASLDLIA